EIWLVEPTTINRAIMAGKRRDSQRVIGPVTFDIEMARRLNLVGKPNWRAMPDLMLEARCTSRICRLVAPEELLGRPYSAGELEERADGAAIDAPEEFGRMDAPAVEAPKRRRRRRADEANETPSPPSSAPTAGSVTVQGGAYESPPKPVDTDPA